MIFIRHKEQYKDLNKWREACRKEKQKYYSKTANAVNHRKRWSDEEIEIILKHEETDTCISKILGRSVKAIQVKRSKLINLEFEVLPCRE